MSGLAPAATAVVVTALAVGMAAQSRPPLVRPGAPGEPTRTITVEEAAAGTRVRHSAGDVRFMQGMIGHHAQALEMVALVPDRSQSAALKLLAQRIDVSQRDEMQMMREWLEQRGEAQPDPHAHHTAHGQMPGMLTAAQMSALAEARGGQFDRLFLEGMIQHHEGALTMVRELFQTPGAGQEPEMFEFASEVESDQGMEIARMRALLKELAK